MRYFYLFRYGGVYLDLDQLCLRELKKTPLLPGTPRGCSGWPIEHPRALLFGAHV